MIVTPAWNGRDTLFYSSAGSEHKVGVAIKLTSQAGKTTPEKLWRSKKVCTYQPTPVRIGDYLYGATNRVFMCVDFNTGKRLWAKRSYPLATCVLGDEKLVLLDQDGWLTLVTATPEGLTVHSRCKVTERDSFTVPTLAGTTLYVRDQKHIMALDLSAAGNG